MSETDLTEVKGRIEAVGRMALELAALLEDACIIDGPSFSARLRSSVRPSGRSPDHLHVARRVLGELADALDESRSAADQPGSGRH